MPSMPPFGRPVRTALAVAVVGTGVALGASASAASAACSPPATDAPGASCRIVFTSNGTFTVPSGVTSADVLVVGGGGAGALLSGGGGGQVLVKPGYAVAGTVAVTVGAGGPGRTVANADNTTVGAGGEASAFGALSAVGGGGGTPQAGGSSGTFTGGPTIVATGLGAGGSGAGAAGNGSGGDATFLTCVAGGPGFDVSSTFPGLVPTAYGGGGAGSTDGAYMAPCPGGVGGGGSGTGFQLPVAFPPVYILATGGLANSGGGAGGGTTTVPDGVTPLTLAAGGSGVVVVQYTALAATVLAPRTRLVSGESAKLSVRARNTGGTAASAVRSCLTLPPNLAVTRAKGGTRTKGQVCFAVGNLAAGATATRTVTVKAVSKRRVTRTVGASIRASGLTVPVAAKPVKVRISPA